MWLAVGVVLLLACLVSLAALWSIRRNRLLTGSGPGTATPTLVDRAVAPLDASQLVEPSGPTPIPPGIGPALQQVSRQPNDPNAYVQLALAYYAAGQFDQAEEQITVIEKLGPPEDFLWLASIQLAGQDAWLPAARLRTDAAEKHLADSGALTERMRDLFSHSLYQAFSGADAPIFLPFDRLGKIDDALAQIAKARFTFYNQDKNTGQNLLDNLIKIKPDMPEAQLLQAEFAARLEKPEAARKALTDLNNNPRATDWMRAVANSIKGAIH
jgi:tetratricopeptide (TPR) repeat protein